MEARAALGGVVVREVLGGGSGSSYGPWADEPVAPPNQPVNVTPALTQNRFRRLPSQASGTNPPSTPTGLTFTNITHHSARLRWNASTGNIMGYRIYHANGFFLTWTHANVRFVDIRGLNSGSTYGFVVVAVGANGSFSASSEVGRVQTSGVTREQEDARARELRDRMRNLMYIPAYNQIRWDRATPAQRETILRELFRDVSAMLGFTPRHDLAFHDLRNMNVHAEINALTRQITINTFLLGDSDHDWMMAYFREWAMLAVIHEARHEFQLNATLQPNRFLVTSQTLSYWAHEFVIENNILINYTTEFPYYFRHAVEWDAWNFMGEGEQARNALRGAGLRPVFEGSWPW